MTLAQNAITFDGVGQVFATKTGPLTALSGVDASINQHEFVAVLGPSGCGKSTLLRLTAGLVIPTKGQVSVYGVPVQQPRDDAGIVFQQATLLPWANVEDNVAFPAKHTRGRISREDRKVAQDVIAKVGLAGFEKRLPSELSGGMQQRVGIARALFRNPDILLMDEPFSALDALTRDQMGYELLNLWQSSPKTVLFITHSIPEALLLADRVLVMSARPGRIIADLKVPLGRPRDEHSLRALEIQELAAELRDLLIVKETA
jgi:NitT/TauT family transport system ATP-binding protein